MKLEVVSEVRVGNPENSEIHNIASSCPLITSMDKQPTPLELRDEITSLTRSKGEDRLSQGSGKDILMGKSSVVHNQKCSDIDGCVRFIKLIDLCF